MEATVTMSLRDYDLMKQKIRNLEEEVNISRKILENLDVEFRNNEQLISKLSDYVMEKNYKKSDLETNTLDDLLKERDYEPGTIAGFYNFAEETLKNYSIDIDMQRDFITRKYNEYRAEIAQEEQEDGSSK